MDPPVLAMHQHGTCFICLKGPQSIFRRLFRVQRAVQVHQKVQEVRGTVDVLLRGYQRLSEMQPSGKALSIATNVQGWSFEYIVFFI